MTVPAATNVAQGSDGNPHDVSQPHSMPLHTAPSQHDLLALKRQRVKSMQRISAQVDEVDQHDQGGRDTCTDAGSCAQEAMDVESTALLESASFAKPLLAGLLGEPMSAYFQRLRSAVGGAGCGQVVTCMQADGVYLHKRPVRAPNSASPLAVCGSVLHHVVVYVKQGPLLHSLDYGPADGSDVTGNVLEEAPAKRVLATSPACGGSAGGGGGGAADELPYLYLGPASRSVDDEVVKKVVAFAESRPYHSLRNNCIHFADTLVRVLTGGAVRGAPLLYDMACGAVPPVDNPMLLMMQLMLRMSWFMVVDGSPLAAAFLEHLRATGVLPQRQQQPQPEPLCVAGSAAIASTAPAAPVAAAAAASSVAAASAGAAAAATSAAGAAAAADQEEDLENNEVVVPEAAAVSMVATTSAVRAADGSLETQQQAAAAAAAAVTGAGVATLPAPSCTAAASGGHGGGLDGVCGAAADGSDGGQAAVDDGSAAASTALCGPLATSVVVAAAEEGALTCSGVSVLRQEERDVAPAAGAKPPSQQQQQPLQQQQPHMEEERRQEAENDQAVCAPRAGAV